MPLRASRPLVGLADLRFICELPLMWALAWCVPEQHWRRTCVLLERFKAAVGMFDPAPVARAMTRALPGVDGGRQAIACAAGRGEAHFQVFRCLRPGGWDATIDLRGTERLVGARAGGRGCVLWVAHFCFSSLAVKIALARAGFPVWHVSRPEHGFSKSRVGIRVFNPIRVAAETPHMAGRILVDRMQPGAALLAARRVLAGNGVVSFTAGAWEGRRPAAVEMLGGRLPLALGAPGLALAAQAPLLPVFVTRGEGRKIGIDIGMPIEPPAIGSRRERLLHMAQEFADRTADRIGQCPAEWRDWKNLDFAAAPVGR